MPIRALIVDDEPLARDRLRGMLRHDTSVEVIGECAHGAEAMTVIRTSDPDLVFLDVQMSGGTGLQLLADLPEDRHPAIVFATAHEQYAVEAFAVSAVDYLLKPFDRERLQLALARVREFLAARLRSPAPAIAPELGGRLAVRSEGRIVFLRHEEIVWVEADDNHVLLHLVSGNLILRETLAAMEAKLERAGFTRVNRSALVRVEEIRELQPALHGDATLVLRDGTKLTLSRSLRGQFEQGIG